MPDGQHRGRLETWQGWRGERLVWTRFQYDSDGSNGIEVRIVVGLPPDERAAQVAARHLAVTLLQALNQAARVPAPRVEGGQ